MTVKVDGCLMDLHTQGQVRQVAIQGLAKVFKAQRAEEFRTAMEPGSMRACDYSDFVHGFFLALRTEVQAAAEDMTVEEADDPYRERWNEGT